jgi:Ribonucleases P/MRP protein subunit POP1
MHCDALTLQAAGEGARDQDGLYNQTQPRNLRRRTKSWSSRKAPASFRNKAHAKGKKRKQPAQAGATGAAAADAQPAHRKSLRRPRALLEARSMHGRAQPELADSSQQPQQQQQQQQPKQQRDLWLETHIWHAKRMTVGSCWGCALPLSALRGAKAAAAAAADHCTVRDASHWRALQLTGAGVAEIAAVLCSMCDPGERQFLQPAQVLCCLHTHLNYLFTVKRLMTPLTIV